jgi:chitodextrinase
METLIYYFERGCKRLAFQWRIAWLFFPLFIFASSSLFAQVSNLLASEDFTVTTGALHGKGSGTGWAANWIVENNSVAIPGYNVSNTKQFQFSNLKTSGNYALGGISYWGSGRSLNVSATGPFANYLVDGNIGAHGKTLYTSILMRKTGNNSQEVTTSFHAMPDVYNAVGTGTISLGYFGSQSDVNGVRYWSVRIGGVVYKTNAPLTIGQEALLVLKIEFGSPNHISLWVNPSSLGGAAPVPNLDRISHSTSVAFKDIGFYAGDLNNQAELDEIRIGDSYAAVTPVADAVAPSVPVNLASSSATQTSLTLSWAASTDNVGVTGYELFQNGIAVAKPSTNSYTVSSLTCGQSYSFAVRARDAAGNWSSQSATINASTTACSDIQGNLLASDDFNVTTGALHSKATGTGWAGNWIVENNTVTVPGYTVSNTKQFQYSNLKTSGNYIHGGISYLGSGRNLNVSASGPFANYLVDGNIGAPGKTIYASILMRKTDNNSQEVATSLHAWPSVYNNQYSTGSISLGYFGSQSDVNGVRYWSVRIGSVVYKTNAVLTIGQEALLVLKIEFGAPNYISLWVNPSSLGGTAPAPNLNKVSHAASVAFKNICFYAGDSNNQAELDEIRIGETYASVTPTTTTGADLVPPGIPANVVASSVTQTSVTLSWAASTDNVGVTGYEVFRNGISIATPASNTYTVTALTCGTTHSFTVRARDAAANWSAQSAVLSVTTVTCSDTQAPSVPTGLSSSNITATSVILSWNAATDDIGVTGYEVLRNGVSIATPSTNSYSVTSLLCATAYSFTVRARDAAGNWSAQTAALNITTTTCTDTQAPSVPTGLTSSSATQTSLSLSWTASTDNTGVTGYDVFRNGQSIATPTGTTYTVTSLTCGTLYSFAVRARDAAGNWSAQTAAINATTTACTDTQAPAVPAGLSSSNVTSNAVTLSWLASTDNAGGSGIAGYDITRNGTIIPVVGTSYTVTGLSASTQYTFAVRARDVAGNVSAYSSSINATTTASPVAGNRVHNFGMNTNGPNDYNPDKIFADAIKTHRQWNIPYNGNGNGISQVPLDANGWPLQDATVLVYHGLSTRNNHGTYKLSFQGQADLTHSGAGVSISNKQYNSATNTTTADLTISDTNNMDLWITFANSRRTGTSAVNTGVTNVKLMRPVSPGSTQSYPTSKIFNDDYVNKLAPIKAIRYMGYLGANFSPDDTWANHTRWNYATEYRTHSSGFNYAGSWEAVILLSNIAKKDAWITIPHKATDDYIQKVAQMFRFGSDGNNPYTSPQANPVVPPLDPGLNVYVEYSNEIWNNGFAQTHWVRETGASYGAPLNFDGETDATTLGFRYKAMRTVQISNIFRSVFGDGPMPAPGKEPESITVRPVLCWQLGYNDLTNRTISFIDRYYNRRDSRSTWSDPHPVSYYLYGGGGSGYWYTDGSSTITADNIWNNGTWNPGEYINEVFRDAAWAKAFGIAYLAYEGDAHPTFSNNDETIMRQTHWDPRMYADTKEHLEAFSAVNGDLFCFLVLQNMSPEYWGVYNVYGGLANSPQYRIIDEMDGTSATPLAKGSVVPFTRPGGSFDVASYQIPSNSTGTFTLTANNDFATAYSFRTTTTGTNNVRVEYSTTAPATLVVEFNGTVLGTYNLASSGGASAFTPLVNIQCMADRLYAIRVVSTAGAVTIRNIIVNSGGDGSTTASRQTLSIAPEAEPENVDVFPNQVNRELNVTLLSEEEQPGKGEVAEISITDVMRKTVLSTKQTLQKGYNTIQLETDNMSNGVYFITIQKGKKRIVKRILVRKQGIE